MALLYIHPPGVSILRRALSDGRRFPLEFLPAKALASRRQARGCTSGAQYYYGSIAAIGMVMRQIFPAMTKVPFLQRLSRVVPERRTRNAQSIAESKHCQRYFIHVRSLTMAITPRTIRSYTLVHGS